MADALALLAHERHAAAAAEAMRHEIEQQKADYRASYPGATEDQIHAWVHDDDPQAPPPPPVLRRGRTLRAVHAEERVTRGRGRLVLTGRV